MDLVTFAAIVAIILVAVGILGLMFIIFIGLFKFMKVFVIMNTVKELYNWFIIKPMKAKHQGK
jgi:cell division protein FtsW (lipid II flippase)